MKTEINMSIETAPPVHERPRCRWCGKPLKPHYDTKKGYGTREGKRKVKPHEMVKVAVIAENPKFPGQANWVNGDPTNESHEPSYLHTDRRYENGHWWFYWTKDEIVSRKFSGHYGYYDLFCNATNCAVGWSRHNALPAFESFTTNRPIKLKVHSNYEKNMEGHNHHGLKG